MTGADDVVAGCLLGAVAAAAEHAVPFRHWLIEKLLPPALPRAIAALPLAPPAIADTRGKRETGNSLRVFLSPEFRARFPVCAPLAEALQRPAVTEALARRCGTALAGAFLRIEYCQDTDGFWLEPHTDIGAKLFTMLIYLGDDRGSAGWGTDLMTRDGTVVATAPYRANSGLIFVPGDDTWHGFRKRPIAGVRRSLIVNYVKPEWRSRRELAYPDQPVA
jgi:hypothetical protein